MKLDALLHPPRRHRPVILIALAALFMLPMLGRKDIVTSHEGRVVQTARLMAASGWPWNAAPVQVPVVSLQSEPGGTLRLRPSLSEQPVNVNPWLVPVLNRAVRLQKPPLPYWCTAILFRLFGFDEGWARLIPALFGVVSVLLVYDLGRRTLGARGGWYAGLAWLSSYFIFDEFRKAMADPYLAFFTLLCVWAWVAATGAGKPSRRVWLVLGAYASLGLLMLAKGILIHPIVAIAAYHIAFRKRPPGPWISHVAGTLLAIAIALPWFAYVRFHVPHAMEIWRFESIGEVTDNDEKARAWWFYLPNLFLIGLPWTPVVLFSIWLTVRRYRSTPKPLCRRRRSLFPLAWYAMTVLAFSFVKMKKNAYLLPMMPAQSLMIAQGLLMIGAAYRRHAIRGVAEVLANLQTVLGIGLAIAMPIMALGLFPNRLQGALLCGVGLLFAWIPLLWKRCSPRWVGAQAVVYLTLIAIFLSIYSAEKENQRSGKPIGQRLAALLADPDAGTIPDRIAPDVAAYVPLELLSPSQSRRLYVVVDDRRDVAKPDASFFQSWVTYGRVTDVRQLPRPANARRGSTRWKTFELLVNPDSK